MNMQEYFENMVEHKLQQYFVSVDVEKAIKTIVADVVVRKRISIPEACDHVVSLVSDLLDKRRLS